MIWDLAAAYTAGMGTSMAVFVAALYIAMRRTGLRLSLREMRQLKRTGVVPPMPRT